MAVEQLFIINYLTPVILCFRSCSFFFSYLKKKFIPRAKVTTFKKTYQPLPPNSIPSTFRIKSVRKVSRAHNTACMLFSGRKKQPVESPNYDKFPQRSFLVGLSLHQRRFFRIHKYLNVFR